MCGSDNHDWLAASAQMRPNWPLAGRKGVADLLHVFFDFRQQCVRPETVAFFCKVDEVPGNSRQESAVLVQECGINVDDMDSRHICFVQLPVDHFILDAQGVFRRFPPGKDVQKNNFSGGVEPMDPGSYFPDTLRRFLRGLPAFVLPCVIGAHHDNAYLGGMRRFKGRIVNAPQYMFRPVASYAEIDRSIGGKILGPYFFAVGFPAVGDGIADKQQLAWCFRQGLL